MKRTSTYKDSGVDVKKAESFVRKIKDKSDKARIASFASLFDLPKHLKKYRKPYLVSSCDGVGTKLKLAQGLDVHHTVGIDLVAMNVNDIVCIGAEPLFFLDYIACGKLNVATLTDVVKGMKRGLRQAGCSLIGGETAEMPGMYKPDEYDLAGFCVGIVDYDRIIDGRNIKQGDLVIGLKSNGLHSNGFSLVRKALTQKEIKRYTKELLRPTRIYVKPILNVLSPVTSHQSPVKGIAHITGGAFYNKATKILPSHCGMVIYKKSWRPQSIFRYIQEKARINDKEMYSVFNMGIGMIVVAARSKVKDIQRILSKYSVQNYVIGEIVNKKQKIAII